MQHRQLLLATAAILALSAGAASAQVTPGWYVGAGAGVTQLRDGDVGGAGKAEYDPGYALLGALGYQFGDFRLELEPGYRKSGLDKFSNSTSSSGDLSALSGMLNIYHDFMPESRFNPYLGVGAGYARVTADNITRNGVRVADGSDGTFAFQGIAGLTYAFTQNLALDVAYRYFDAQDAKIGGNDVDFKSHTLTAGLVWRFGAPPPPAPMAQPAATPAPAPVARPAPPPAPTPAPPPPAAALPNVYIVFFAFDKSDITPVAAQVLDRAIADFRSTGSTGIRIEGHTDRAGSDKYNLALSKRRADAVKAYLTGKGVGAGAIAEEAFGESKPRVATPDGARNDENRRAEIYLRK